MDGTKLEYGPLKLISGKQIKFRPPLGKDRINVMQVTKVGAEDAISGTLLVDTYIKAKCITEIDGKRELDDFKHLFDNWADEDVQYYSAVYNEMFGVSDDRQQKAKEEASFLLTGRTSSDGSSSATA